MTNNDVIELIRENCTVTAPDFLAKLDFEAVKEYRETIRSPKVKNYVMAAAIYAAACLVIVITIPIFIGHGRDPEPTPGIEPVITETHAPGPAVVPEGKINVTDIPMVYIGTETNTYPDTVTLEDIRSVIEAARKAYEEYDTIVLKDGTEVSTTPKMPERTRDNIGEYTSYLSTLFPVVRDAVSVIFPENAYFSSGEEPPHMEYYVPDLEGSEYESVEDIKANMIGWIYYGSTADMLVIWNLEQCIRFYMPADTDTGAPASEVLLYPTQEENDYLANSTYDESLLSETAVFDGLEYTITLDKETYTTDDRITVNVRIENVGDETVVLWQEHASHYLCDVRFYENGVEKPEFLEKQLTRPEAEESWSLNPGAGISRYSFFTPGNPSIDGTTPASSDSIWEIKAFVNYVTNVPEDSYNPASLPLEELKTGSVSIIVPHETDVPDETDPPIEPEPTGTTTVNAPEPPVEITTPKETDPPVTTPKETDPPVTTPEETEPVKEPTVYPDPYISNRTERSITKTLYGCEYTITLDKSSYKPGETVRATVTLENKGDLTLHFSSGSGRDFLSNVKMYEYEMYDPVWGKESEGVLSSGNPIFDSPTVIAYEDLKPGDKWTYTAECDTSLADPYKGWYYLAKIYFSVDGKPVSESLEIDVYHDIPEDTLASDPYTKLPSLDQFSAERIEERTNYFADVESATLYKNGTAIPLAKDDPRLVQLINFMTWSDEEPVQSHYIIGGFLHKEDYETAKSTDFRLEINFANTSYKSNGYISLCEFDRVIVLGDTVFLIDDQEEPNYDHIGYIEEYSIICTGWFPYAQLFSDSNAEFDILTYAGFNNITAE